MGIRDRSEPRDGYAVRVLAVHTSEGFDKPAVDDAAALRDASWWTGSSHAIADNDPGSLLTPAEGCVPYDRASWTLRSGSRWSENIELIAQAGWTRAQWLERSALLDRCAYWLATRSQARGIPLVKLTPQQYRAGGWGVIGHHDHTVGYSDGTHWDPGPGFPWDIVLARARQIVNGDDMPTMDEFLNTPAFTGGPTISQVFLDLHHRTRDVTRSAAPGGKNEFIQEIANAYTVVMRIEAKLEAVVELARTLAADRGDDFDVEALLARIDARIDASIEEGLAEGVDVRVTVGEGDHEPAAGPVS